MSLTPLQTAQAERQQKIAEAQQRYSDEVTEVNTAFADTIRSAASGDRSMTEIALELGLSRQQVYELIRKYPSAA